MKSAASHPTFPLGLKFGVRALNATGEAAETADDIIAAVPPSAPHRRTAANAPQAINFASPSGSNWVMQARSNKRNDSRTSLCLCFNSAKKLAMTVAPRGGRDNISSFTWRVRSLTAEMGQRLPSRTAAGSVRFSQDRSGPVRKADIGSPMTGMRTIPAVPDDRQKSPVIAKKRHSRGLLIGACYWSGALERMNEKL